MVMIKYQGGRTTIPKKYQTTTLYGLFIAAIVMLYCILSLLGPKSQSTINATTRTYTSEHSAILTVSFGIKIPASIKPGDYHTCSLIATKQIYCAGYNAYGSLGDGTTDNRQLPTNYQLPTGELGVEVNTTSTYYTCALTTSQLIYCAGRNNSGQLGDTSTNNRSTPVLFVIPGGKKAAKVEVNFFGYHTCALTTDQLVFCAGLNNNGMLGDSSTTTRPTPVPFPLPGGRKAIAVNVSLSHTCALTTDQLVFCAGLNNNGDLGDTTTTSPRTAPVQFQLPVGKPAFISAGLSHVCVLTTDKTVYCSGDNLYGQLGNGDTLRLDRPTPVQFLIPGGRKAVKLIASGYHTCVLTTDQLVFCAGYNNNGQLGDTSIIDRPVPAQYQLPGGKTAVAVNTTYYRTCVLTNDQLVYCAGYNNNGQLGNGTTTDSPTPVQFQIPGGRKAIKIDTSTYATCALTSDLLAYCAGFNNYGQLGNNNITANETFPVKFTLP